MSASERASLNALRRKVMMTAFDAMTQLNQTKEPVYYLDPSVTATVADVEWGELVEAYNAVPLRAIFLDRPGGTTPEVVRDLGRDQAVVIVAEEDVRAAGLTLLNPDGTLDTSGRFLIRERYPLNYQVVDLVVRHLGGQPWRYVFTVKEAQTHHRVDPTGERVENLMPRPENVPGPYGSDW